MEKEERIQKEIEKNTLNFLTKSFDLLLQGLDTEKYKFKDKKEEKELIESIKNIVNYRLKEKIIPSESRLYNLLLDIKSSNLSNKRKSKRILEKLILLNWPNLNNYPNLKSEHFKYYSKYVKQKLREKNMARGSTVLKRFFDFLGIN